LALVEDHGRIYVGTTRGIARIDPRTDEIIHYGAEDGLRNEYIIAAFRSRDGSLWFGSKGGAARLVPREDVLNPPPPVYITHLALAGKPVAITVGGQRWIDSIELGSGEGALDIDLASPQLASGTHPRFQFRLGDKWSAPVTEHTLHFAQLAAGHYDLEVRAIDARGVPSRSATIVFAVLPPVWRRWWFVALAAATMIALGYLAYRRRLAHMVAIERVRTRIATDLHDELGSSLSRISILSEVASRRAAAQQDVGGQIDVIGSSARELVDVAADIVWATDPRRDDLGSLLIRLRTFAADLCDARGIEWSIVAPNDPSAIKLAPDRRRHLYLVLKEAITNAARHSSATRVDVVVKLTMSGLVASVRDNGTGFDEPSLARRGNGLTNMRARAAEAGGKLDVHCNGGTEVVLRL
jgi:signal transduction histidine kinase